MFSHALCSATTGTVGAEYSAFSSLIGAFLHPDNFSLAEDFLFGGFIYAAGGPAEI
jgi:ABC-type enterochelin transport system permease subunit